MFPVPCHQRAGPPRDERQDHFPAEREPHSGEGHTEPGDAVAAGEEHSVPGDRSKPGTGK